MTTTTKPRSTRAAAAQALVSSGNASTAPQAGAAPQHKHKAAVAPRSAPQTALKTATAESASSGRIVRLSDPEMRGFIEDIKHRIKTEPGFGRSLMRSAGILTPSGKLAKKYGG